jgi:hypothetical protein
MVPTRIDAAAAVSSVNNHTNIIRIAKKSTTTTEVLKQQVMTVKIRSSRILLSIF